MADATNGADPDMSDGGLEAEDPALAAASELAQPSPEPESGFAGFAVLLVAFVFAVLFLQRSRKKRSGAPEPAKRTPIKGAAKEAPSVKAATPAAAAADAEPGCCASCATELPQLTWRNTERQRLFCCGAALCQRCFDETAQRVASSAVDEGSADGPPTCPQCSSSLLMSDSVQMERLRGHAEAGKAWAQYELGSRCESGEQGVTQDLADAAYWYELAHEQGYPLAPARLGSCLLLGWEGAEKDYARAKKLLLPAAKKGDARAQRYLAQIYDGGLGVPPSQSDSILWLERAAEQGFALGQADLGYMYEHGRGVTRSFKMARKWYKLAADQGERNAQFLLGGLLLNTRGEKSLPTAMRLCRLAASQAHLDAIETLVQMESNLKRSCSHCRSFKEGLTRCSRCKAAYYCGSACQMAHWKAGHAQDCCDSGPDCSHLLAMAMDTRAMAPMGMGTSQ